LKFGRETGSFHGISFNSRAVFIGNRSGQTERIGGLRVNDFACGGHQTHGKRYETKKPNESTSQTYHINYLTSNSF
jgi:hypothetical protein